MTGLLWPGDDRCDGLLTDDALLAAMARVETAWLAALVETSVAPASVAVDLVKLLEPGDTVTVASAAESSGTPVLPLLDLLRSRLDGPAAEWLHKGLTSQDTLDTALVLGLREACDRIRHDLAAQVASLAALAAAHRDTPRAARTLTQPAVPITFGLTVATWLGGVLDAAPQLTAAARLPVAIGGAAGSLAAATALSPVEDLVSHAADHLGLPPALPWQTRRGAITRLGDALTGLTDAWAHIANDVLTASRPEIGELAEGTGGASSTMPQKRNPTLSVLIRRAALAAPGLSATLHTAAGEQRDERADGAWHVEGDTVRTLARRTVIAGSQTASLLRDLTVDVARMAANLAAARPGVDAEQTRVTGNADGPYRGVTDAIIDAALRRAEVFRAAAR
ncbi:lyase family protein [Actinoplanes sp. NBRC 103695]|uniref:lyase family protein n=1 Tax=Actinoplanes sp. NBRC 103695 TaxID=3032202 RepID=UPI0024A44787|nr:lyase family protein [Actinoplanes sp. NBRC 103695]GLZ00077.1 3-carboxy-cis,cis-muconate cycloisomerase [Actinoplanes sp. NBRC 103695]